MSDRERARRVIGHQEVFPVPYRLKFMPTVAEWLKEALGLPDVDRSVGNALVHLKMTPQPPAQEPLEDSGQVDEFGCIWLVDKDGGPYVAGHPLASGGLDTYSLPDPQWPPRFHIMALQAAAETDRFILFSFEWSLFERAHFLRGMEQFLVDMLLEPLLAEALLDRILEFNLAVIERVCQMDIDGIIFGDDYGSQRGLLISPQHWRRFLKPRLQQQFGLTKQYGKVACLHSCGDVTAVVPDLIEIGLDVLNPLQPEVLDLSWLKREYGKDLCFYGGISTQQTLPFGTPDDVRAEVRERIEVMAQDGGYIIAPGITVLADTPLENVLAFVDAVQRQEAL
jgi:uroporphyrinogen decarboxylase